MRARKTKVSRHETLRRSALVLALVLFIHSVSVDSPFMLAQDASTMVSSAVVGVSAGVAPNPDNMLALQLEQRAQELDAREAQIARSETVGGTSSTRLLALASFVLSLVLVLLVSFNYYLDWRRARVVRVA